MFTTDLGQMLVLWFVIFNKISNNQKEGGEKKKSKQRRNIPNLPKPTIYHSHSHNDLKEVTRYLRIGDGAVVVSTEGHFWPNRPISQ